MNTSVTIFGKIPKAKQIKSKIATENTVNANYTVQATATATGAVI